MRVLDVGAGVGKFCIIAAHEVPRSRFVGVELRPHLVDIARQLAARFEISNVSFVQGDALGLDWAGFDAFYFYNPFAEHLFDPAFVIDHAIDLAAPNFLVYMMGVRARLAAARAGTRLVTYHGIGAPPPAGYQRVSTHHVGPDILALWIKDTP